ncbi:sialate O-acetylesterase [Pedobacter immunditicola]|uniref:sialate O-acetylesterase n=1 Tax=Pedobacter immunditicola TaxID=3133440 RepID=UPI0030A1DBB6
MKGSLAVKKLMLLSLVCMVGMGAAKATILLPQILSSNMVLQRQKPLTIWGYGAAGEPVRVSFAGQHKRTVTSADGKWQVLLEPLKTSSTPATMTIEGSNKITLNNILVGEVWLCSGQSNMEYAMRKLVKSTKPLKEHLGFPTNEVKEANDTQIRIFLVNRKTLPKPDSTHKSWSVAQDSALKAFSIVGYFFAKKLHEELGVPVGIISSAVSGSAIEPWIAEPGKFYTTMIAPLTNFGVRGFLWYQGETNCFLKENISYANKMKSLIENWRTAWKDTQLPFYYVQLAPYNYSKSKGKIVLDEQSEPEFWEAQAQVLRLPYTGMVVSTDLNDNGDDLHPTYKWEVGRRLALWALAKDYGKKINYSGPFYKAMKIKGSKAIIDFAHVGKGLYSNDGKPITGFTVSGADGKFENATAVVKGNQIVVSSKNINRPVAVRFGWHEAKQSNLFNKDGLPAMPFRTDNPLTEQFIIAQK